MNGVSRRRFVALAGGLAGSLLLPAWACAARSVTVEMQGAHGGGRGWFDPVGLLVAPGTWIRFHNQDDGNSHTATAYHEGNDRPRRIPPRAVLWDSSYLLPDETYEVRLELPGVYDYFCRPHERAGMVGRIVVGRPETSPSWAQASSHRSLPEAAMAAFPAVEAILSRGLIRSTGQEAL